MTFPNRRNIEEWIARLDESIASDIEFRAELEKFLDTPSRGAPASRSEALPDGAWRDHPASERQLRILDQYKVRYESDINKGAASDLIQDLFARRDK